MIYVDLFLSLFHSSHFHVSRRTTHRVVKIYLCSTDCLLGCQFIRLSHSCTTEDLLYPRDLGIAYYPGSNPIIGALLDGDGLFVGWLDS